MSPYSPSLRQSLCLWVRPHPTKSTLQCLFRKWQIINCSLTELLGLVLISVLCKICILISSRMRILLLGSYNMWWPWWELNLPLPSPHRARHVLHRCCQPLPQKHCHWCLLRKLPQSLLLHFLPVVVFNIRTPFSRVRFWPFKRPAGMKTRWRIADSYLQFHFTLRNRHVD